MPKSVRTLVMGVRSRMRLDALEKISEARRKAANKLVHKHRCANGRARYHIKKALETGPDPLAGLAGLINQYRGTDIKAKLKDRWERA